MFAGQVEFLKGVVAMDGLPRRPDRGLLRRSVECGKIQPDQCADRAEEPGPRLEHPWSDAGNQLFHHARRRPLPGRPARLQRHAEAPVAVVTKWQQLLKSYLSGRPTLRQVFVLIDMRHGVKAVDEF